MIRQDLAIEENMAYRALNRRKLFVINGRLKFGRWTYFEDRGSMGTSAPLSIPSGGIICSRSLSSCLSFRGHI